MNATLKRLLTLAAILLVVAAVEYVTEVEILGIIPSPQTADTTQVAAPPPGDAPESVDGLHLRLVSWNIRDLGRSKNAAEIAVMAQTLRNADLVAIQEVVTSPPGAQAVARLDAALDRTGFQWDYRLSDPTTGDGTERYAFLWKPSRVRIVGRPWLEESLAATIDREPFCGRFENRRTGERLLVASLHAVPRSKDPEHEIRQLPDLHRQYGDDHIVIVGDFNLDEDDAAFDGLRALGYGQVLDDQPTSLRRKRRDGPMGHFANEYDNIFYESTPLRVRQSGIMDFTRRFETLRAARRISDHVPLYADVGWPSSGRLAP
jgi:endonuclease/exonuclease/phosphatase family metal-dependent hydrolase